MALEVHRDGLADLDGLRGLSDQRDHMADVGQVAWIVAFMGGSGAQISDLLDCSVTGLEYDVNHHVIAASATRGFS